MFREKYKENEVKKSLAELSSILDASVKEDRSKMYAGLTVGSFVAFGALAGAGGCLGVEELQNISIPFLLLALVSGCKALKNNGFEVTDDAMYKFMVKNNPILASKREEEVKEILSSYKENNAEINKRCSSKRLLRKKKDLSINNYSNMLESLKEM